VLSDLSEGHLGSLFHDDIWKTHKEPVTLRNKPPDARQEKKAAKDFLE